MDWLILQILCAVVGFLWGMVLYDKWKAHRGARDMTSQHPKNKFMIVRMTELQKQRLEEMAEETGRNANDMIGFLIATTDVSEAAENYRRFNPKKDKNAGS